MNPDLIRIFVGCDSNDCDLEQMMVLDHSLRTATSAPVEIHWMRLSSDRESFWYAGPGGWRTERWATPFSGFRWAVPAFCNFAGRAIYMDIDTLVLSDLDRLWRMPVPAPAIVGARHYQPNPRFCVSIWDCEQARRHLLPMETLRGDPAAHAKSLAYFRDHGELIAPMDPAFNCIDGEDRPIADIGVLHYSDMGTQFSHRRSFTRLAAENRQHWFDGELLPHPRRDLQALFDRTYEAALASGRRLDDYRNPAPLGAFRKKSHRDYRGNRFTRANFGSLFQRLLRH